MNFLEMQLKDPVRLARLQRWFYIGLAAVALAEIFLPHMFRLVHAILLAAGAETLANFVLPLSARPHFHFGFERIPAWGSFYGLVSCILIIVVSKFLGKFWLMRRENYYDS